MNLRTFVVLVYGIAFFLSIGGILSIPGDAWKYIALWQQALFAFYVLVGFCGILIAYWVYEDGETLRWMEELNHEFRKRIEELERKKATS